MLRNLLFTAIRALKKNSFFSFLNIIGLCIGMSVLMLISQYIHFEESYESFIPDAQNIYRVTLATYINNELIISSAENYPGAGPALQHELPEVLAYARLYNLGYKNNVIITNEEATPEPIAFKQRGFLYADSSFLPIMQYPMIEGDAATALAAPLTAVISEKYAKMYFGSSNAVGKQLRMQDDDNNNELVSVTGVFKDLPENTHLKFDVLFSYKTLYTRGSDAVARYDQSWKRKDMYTFVKVQPGTDILALESKLPALVQKYNPGLEQRNQRDILKLQPIEDIHLTSHLAEEPALNGDQRIVRFLGLIGVFVLLIAWINYINLATAKAMERAKEVGVRKVMGAVKGQLVSQFLAESGLIHLMALLLALLVALLVLAPFNSLSGLSLNWSYFFEPWFFILIALLWISGTLLSGLYPAFILSSFAPVIVLKGKLRNSGRGLLLRKSLVVFQFMASVALIAGTLVVYDQINFMMKQDLGVNISQVLVIERPGIAPPDRNAFMSAIDVFRNTLQEDETVEAMAASGTVPGKQREYKTLIKKFGSNDDASVTVRINSMDYHFMDVFQMKLLAGRVFSAEHVSDLDTAIVITESVSRLLGFSTPAAAIGQTLALPNFQWNPIIIGVVNDYHQVSLKQALDPTIFYCSLYDGEFYSVRLKTGDIQKSIDVVKHAWLQAFPGNPFTYFFLDDYFNRQYENERKFGTLFTTFSGIAIAVGCLGLFGLSAFTATQRTKEIGVRKVLGSTVGSIFVLLAREYLALIALACAIAVPVVYVGMQYWIESFPYQIPIRWSIFLIAGGAVVCIAFFTISYQTLKAARANPVIALRSE